MLIFNTQYHILLYYIILYYMMLTHCIVTHLHANIISVVSLINNLYYTLLYYNNTCIPLYYSLTCYIMLCDVLLYYIMIYYDTLYYVISYYIISYYDILSYIILYSILFYYIIRHRWPVVPLGTRRTPAQYGQSPCTKIPDFRGFDSSIILILRGGILMSIGSS